MRAVASAPARRLALGWARSRSAARWVQHRTHIIIRATTHTVTRIRPPRAIIRRRHITRHATVRIRITGGTTPARLRNLWRSGAPLATAGLFLFDVHAEPFGGV